MNGGADGSALAKAVMNPVNLNLSAGSHTVILSGTVKDNSALADISFHITEVINIVTPGCGNN